ncbi:FxsA family protein [Actinosynnema sp. NPDC091369]
MRVLAVVLVGLAVEVTALVAAFGAWGLLPTLGLLVLGGVVGSVLLRREGVRAVAAFSEALRTRRAPHRELADGVLIAVAGVLIVLPGFVSDVVGLLLLFPPARRLVSGRMARRAAERERSVVLNLRYGQHPMAGGVVVDGVVDGDVVDVRSESSGERRELP